MQAGASPRVSAEVKWSPVLQPWVGSWCGAGAICPFFCDFSPESVSSGGQSPILKSSVLLMGSPSCSFLAGKPPAGSPSWFCSQGSHQTFEVHDRLGCLTGNREHKVFVLGAP